MAISHNCTTVAFSYLDGVANRARPSLFHTGFPSVAGVRLSCFRTLMAMHTI